MWRSLLLLCRCSTINKPSNFCSTRYFSAGLTGILHRTRFSSTDERRTSRQDLTREKSSHEVTAVLRTDATYSALMDSAKTKSQLSNRAQFGLVLKEFMSREKYRRGHVTFINMALERMEEFELEKDLLTYNRLLDVLPKGRYHPKRLLDALWPRPLPQTELALELLTRMEDNGIWPDDATYSLLVEVFGKHSLPVEKCERMSYWYERYKDADPYWIDGELPKEAAELSKLAMQRIVNNDGSVTEHELVSATDSGLEFILSGHTAAQLQVLGQLSSILSAATNPLLYVEGPHRIWINKSAVNYFSLRLSANDSKHVRNNAEGAVVAVCMCHPHTQRSLQQWIKELQLTYPFFMDATIVYNIRTDSSSHNTLLDNDRHDRAVGKIAGTL